MDKFVTPYRMRVRPPTIFNTRPTRDPAAAPKFLEVAKTVNVWEVKRVGTPIIPIRRPASPAESPAEAQEPNGEVRDGNSWLQLAA